MRAWSIAAPRLLMEHLPAPVSFYRQFRRRRTPIAGTDFLLDQGRIDIQPGAQFNDTAAILRIFSLMATHGYTLSQAAEDRITDALPVLAISIPEGPYLWNALREVLLGPHAAHALRTMHALGVLEMLIPEFHGIDALVIRDSYHRYTVDEHTFLVIDNVHCPAPAGQRARAAPRATAPGDRPARSVSPGAASARHRQRRAATASTRRKASSWPTAFWRGWISTPRSASRFSS